MPAYNAEKTLRRTYQEIPRDIVDDVILVDDFSKDDTVSVARSLGLMVVQHETNAGYGANQKTCYRHALACNADIVVMLHPDYQYQPKLITAMAGLVASELFDVVLGSRILGGHALPGGMPLYKYVANRALTLFQNLLTGHKLSEYHTGYRVFSRKVLESLPLNENSNDFVFDNQMLMQILLAGFRVGEITAGCAYHKEASSIGLRRGIRYGWGVVVTTVQYVLQKRGLVRLPLFDFERGRRLAR